MHVERSDNVSVVTAAGLCTGCGVCAGVCPKACIQMRETPAGALAPRVDTSTCVRCGQCVAVCAGWREPSDETDADPFIGAVRSVHVAYAAAPSVRDAGNSGGVVTALLLAALREGLVDATTVVSAGPKNALRPKMRLTSDERDIVASAGSRYCPVSCDAALRDLHDTRQRVAFAGLGCHTQGLALVRERFPSVGERLALVIGLFCARTQLFGAAACLARRCGIAPHDVASFAYRSKALDGWPGSVVVQARDGRQASLARYELFNVKALTTPVRCRLCFDKLNACCDLAIGDPWELDLPDREKGYSMILARTERGEAFLKRAADRGELVMEPGSLDDVLRSQGIDAKRREHDAYCATWRALGRALPDWRHDALKAQGKGRASLSERTRFALELTVQEKAGAALARLPSFAPTWVHRWKRLAAILARAPREARHD